MSCCDRVWPGLLRSWAWTIAREYTGGSTRDWWRRSSRRRGKAEGCGRRRAAASGRGSPWPYGRALWARYGRDCFRLPPGPKTSELSYRPVNSLTTDNRTHDDYLYCLWIQLFCNIIFYKDHPTSVKWHLSKIPFRLLKRIFDNCHILRKLDRL